MRELDPQLINCFLNPHEFPLQTTFRSVQRFQHTAHSRDQETDNSNNRPHLMQCTAIMWPKNIIGSYTSPFQLCETASALITIARNSLYNWDIDHHESKRCCVSLALINPMVLTVFLNSFTILPSKKLVTVTTKEASTSQVYCSATTRNIWLASTIWHNKQIAIHYYTIRDAVLMCTEKLT